MIDIEVVPAILAGLIAGAIMEGPVYLQKALRLPVNCGPFGALHPSPYGYASAPNA